MGKTYSKPAFITLGLVAGAAIIFTVLGLAMGWFKTGTDIISADNVKQQHEHVIGHYESLIAAADNVCAAQGEVETDSRSATLVESPAMAYEATFRNIVVDYNSAMDNLFRAKIVAPPGYPESLAIKDLDTTDWCTVSSQLHELKEG